MTKSRQKKGNVSLKAATKEAIAEIDSLPGEFRIHDLTDAVMKTMGISRVEDVYAPRLCNEEHWKHWQRTVREWVNVRLRKTFDEFGLRLYICYSIKGKRVRHWLKADNMTKQVMKYLLTDRDALVDDIEDLRPYLELGLTKMEARGPDITFGDVKAEVVAEIRARR